jgi:hypothetical protein
METISDFEDILLVFGQEQPDFLKAARLLTCYYFQ